MPAVTFAAFAALGASLAALAAVAWPRGLVTHRYEVFIAAPPKTVWDTYFVHINKSDYRPGTRLLDVEILNESPLTVRATLQQDIASQPRQVVFTYDVYEPYASYRLGEATRGLLEEGEFVAEPGGTRLRVAITGRMFGFIMPALARRRVEHNQLALKQTCERQKVPSPRPSLPRPARWEAWIVLAVPASLLLSPPWWPLQLALAVGGLGVLVLWLRRFALLVRRF
jgi:hypothetical protein